jgi:hypothetical protein
MARAFVVVQHLLVFERDDDVLVRADVGDTRREHVRPLLFDERRLASVRLGVVVRAARFGALLDLTFDHAVADVHRHVIDGGLVGQWENVHALAPLRGRIREALDDLHARDHAAHVHVHVGGQERRRGLGAGLVAQQQGPLVDVAAVVRRLGLETDDEHGEGEHEAHEDPGDETFEGQPAQLPPFAAQDPVC